MVNLYYSVARTGNGTNTVSVRQEFEKHFAAITVGFD